MGRDLYHVLGLPAHVHLHRVAQQLLQRINSRHQVRIPIPLRSLCLWQS